ncbi:MAG: adenosine deaminase family protein [Chloroflexi bacterium]|nr:adenosine deaminase family protein [Chloroflexota bacterium]
MSPTAGVATDPAIWVALPKAELHVHLRGAMPVAVFAELLNRHGVRDLAARAGSERIARWAGYPNIRPFLTPRSWAPAEVAPLFRYQDFDQFLQTFAFTGWFVRTASDFARLVDGVLANLRTQRIVYAEITVSAKEYLRHGIALADLIAILDAAASARAPRVQWIVDLVRDFGHESGLALLDDIVAARPASIVGITLGGSEHRYPPALFQPLYQRAAALGLRRTVHAGEGLGPASVRDALDLLAVERIGHGVRAIEDMALVRRLAEAGVPLEVCPTSNLATGLYASYAAHPLPRLRDAGVVVTLNSDDPTFFGATLADEYAAMAAAGMPRPALLDILRGGFRHAFLPPAEVAAFLADVDAAHASWQARAAGG